MPRRLAVLSALVLALVLAVGTLAVASGGDDGTKATTTPSAAKPAPATPVGTTAPVAARPGLPFAGGRHGGAMMKMVQKVVLDSLASRLQVTPAALRTGIHAVAVDQFAKAAKQAGLTDAQTDALKACHVARVAAKTKTTRARGAAARKSARKAHHRTRADACDRSVIRPALKKLKALPKPDLAPLKTELSDALAAELGTTGAKVLEAFRAELDQRLGQAVGFGFVTEAGKTKALACFDSPATCDPKALRRELRGPAKAMAMTGRHHGGRGHRR
jgi:hypothetical protein